METKPTPSAGRSSADQETAAEDAATGASETTETAAVPAGMTRRQLIENYAAIIHAGALYYPVAYQFLRELGRGRQGIVFLGLRQGARG